MFRSDNPVRDAEMWLNYQSAEEENCPDCEMCGEKIYDVEAWDIPNFGLVCKDCIDNMKVYLEG